MRGRKSKIGDERTSPNGYQYVRTNTGWELKHKIVCENHLKRRLTSGERVRFIDGDRTNLDPNNLEVFEVRVGTRARRIAQLESKIEDLQAQLKELKKESA